MRAPQPTIIARYLGHLQGLLNRQPSHNRRASRCDCLNCTAALLAGRGWPTSTNGDGRGSNNGSSTETAALTDPEYRDLDTHLNQALRRLWADARLVEDLIHRTRNHGNDSEQVASLGDCCCCGRFCNPKVNQADRLVSGYCPACYTAWRRWLRDNPGGSRSDFIHTRRRSAA